MAPKRKAVAAEEAEDDVDEDQEDAGPSKPKKPRAKPAPKITAPTVNDAGWHIEPPNLIWKNIGDIKGNTKIAAYDLDGTLVNQKSGAKFPVSIDDWRFFNKNVVKKVSEQTAAGYKIVIFTNQGSIKTALAGKASEKVQQRIELVVKELGVAVQVFVAPSMVDGDEYRKPAAGMWKYMVSNCNDGVKPDLSSCFFVGDAAGRPGDFAGSDRGFAEAAGIAFKTPEEEFGPVDGKKDLVAVERPEGQEGPNHALVQAFKQKSDDTFADPDGNKFAAGAFRKAATALDTFPDVISEKNLKEVAKLKGVGKGSLAMIKQWLATGSLETDASAEVEKLGPAAKTKDNTAAAQGVTAFM